MPRLARIDIHPIKSLNPVSVPEIPVLPSGALAYDRRWAIINEEEKKVNGKKEPRIHLLTLEVPDLSQITKVLLSSDIGQLEADLALEDDRYELEQYLSEHFGYPVKLIENETGGFPDDQDNQGPTLVSTASLELVSSWFPVMTVEEARLRFRANLEIDEVEPFWEDTLYGKEGEHVPFQIGNVVFEGVSPCVRCVVPTRDPETGEKTDFFTKTFQEKREEHLPDHVERSRFNHFFRFTINTHLGRQPEQADAEMKIAVGDEVEVLPHY